MTDECPENIFQPVALSIAAWQDEMEKYFCHIFLFQLLHEKNTKALNYFSHAVDPSIHTHHKDHLLFHARPSIFHSQLTIHHSRRILQSHLLSSIILYS